MVSLMSIAADFYELIATSWPQILNLFEDDDDYVHEPLMDALLEFSENGM